MRKENSKHNKADTAGAEQYSAAHRAYLGLGSSVGNRAAHLRDALERLGQPGRGVTVQAVSPVYETPHLGLEPGDETRFPPHLNCVALVTTTRNPLALLACVQAIETEGERCRDLRWGPRTIDIDILLYDDIELHTDKLTLPHPQIAARVFVVRPLLDLAPELALPDGRRLADIYDGGNELNAPQDEQAHVLQATPLRTQAIRRVEPDELFI